MDIITKNISYNNNLQIRQLDEIELIVIHCTELPDLPSARKMAEQIIYSSETGNCGHYYVDFDGQLHQWVEQNRVAHHVKNHNQHSIGIELCHIGRYPQWYKSSNQNIVTPYKNEQIETLITLIKQLKIQIGSINYITGHEHLDRDMIASSDNPQQMIRRKIDPGPTFPWQKVLTETNLKMPP